MLKRKNKKGFTLAELLIVVAIIAVLVAIAVPLFVGALDKAEERVFESNQRSIKSMAVASLLGSKGFDGSKETGPWLATGEVSADGSIKITNIVQKDKAEEGSDEATKYEDYVKPTDSKPATIIVEITKSELKTDYTTPAAGD